MLITTINMPLLKGTKEQWLKWIRTIKEAFHPFERNYYRITRHYMHVNYQLLLHKSITYTCICTHTHTHTCNNNYLKMLQIIFLYHLRQVVHLHWCDHCAESKYRRTISHCWLVIKCSLCIHQQHSHLQQEHTK